MAEPVNALRGIDKALAAGTWVTAAILVVMLFLGPAVIANDDETIEVTKAAGSSPYGKDAGANGRAVFVGNCGSCHTLSDAGTSGQVGPNLDDTSLSASDIESVVRGGRGSMPSFEGKLSDAEISAVAAFVDGSN